MIAKTSPHILSPELYALHLGTHFVTKYPHIHKAFITIEQLKWSRIPVDGAPHKHSFVRDGEEKIVVDVEVDGTDKDKVSAKVQAGIKDLLGRSFATCSSVTYTCAYNSLEEHRFRV